ncbi:MAG: aminopeptidase P family protein [Chloroflexi bacterium]|nr:aminopeptidase P family protein [Chloroflexota bacterium]
MTTTGAMALETGEPIDFGVMRRERFQRTLESMERHALDVLLLAKPANVKYVAGSRSLWTASRRPFSPSAVVIRERAEFHLMSLWDHGVPRSVPKERLFPPSWNPLNLMETVTRIVGANRRGRIGVDLMSPLFASLLAEAFPQASVVDGAKAMGEARAVKTAEEVDCLRTATAIAEAALTEAIAALRPGVTERSLLGVFLRRATDFGVTAPAYQGGFCVQPRDREAAGGGGRATPPMRQMSSPRPVQSGELVAMGGGVHYAGYESDVGRTWLCGDAGRSSPRAQAQRALYRRWVEACQAMAEQCRPEKTAADLRRAFQKTELLPGTPIAHGAGLGFEPPMVGVALGVEVDEASVLQAGMVLVLQPYVWEEGVGGFWAKETVLITSQGHERLTTLPHGPLAEA